MLNLVLPQLSKSEVELAVAAAIGKTNALSVKDKNGRPLKGNMPGRVNFAKISVRVKAMLGG